MPSFIVPIPHCLLPETHNPSLPLSPPHPGVLLDVTWAYQSLDSCCLQFHMSRLPPSTTKGKQDLLGRERVGAGRAGFLRECWERRKRLPLTLAACVWFFLHSAFHPVNWIHPPSPHPHQLHLWNAHCCPSASRELVLEAEALQAEAGQVLDGGG